MTLHTNKTLFFELINATAKEMNLPFVYIEKDYWVTYILKRLSQSSYSEIAIFKGGTSLSKAYKIIERFSEDIDLAVITNELGSNQIKKLIKQIETTIVDENFEELPHHIQTSKGSSFRKSVHNYSKLQDNDFGHAQENIIIELNSFAQPHPYENKIISTYISDFLYDKAPEIIEEYNLQSFRVNVLSYKRTFCEKISAIARASFESDVQLIQLKEKIRHFYDIYFLMQEEEIQNFLHSSDFVDMMKKVRIDDSNQFSSNDWTTADLCSTLIFTNTADVLNQLKHFYISNFKDLVYTAQLPKIDSIIKEIVTIAVILKNHNL